MAGTDFGAPFEVNPPPFLPDAPIEFTCPLGLTTPGEPFPFSQYAFDYVIDQGGSRVAIGAATVDPDEGWVTFRGPALSRGTYQHFARMRHLETGKPVPWFDGTLTIRGGRF